jgi:putative transposase
MPNNHRNGTSKKTLLSEDGKLEIEIPRDRSGEFDPQFIRKGQRRFGGFDQKIIAMYAQGMTVREIQRFLEEQYKVEVSADSDQHGDRLGPRRRPGVANSATRANVSGGFL